MRLSKNKTINKTEAVSKTATTGVQTSFPRLETVYNISNPPTDILFHWFGKETNNKVDKGEIKEIEVTLNTPIDETELRDLVKSEGIEVSEKDTIDGILTTLEKQSLYVVVDYVEKTKETIKK